MQTNSTTTKVNNDARFDEMLERLRDCEGLVEQELAEYRTASPETPAQDSSETEKQYLLSIITVSYTHLTLPTKA